MMKFPSIDKIAKEAAQKALDDIEIEGKTVREWIEMACSENVAAVVRCKDCKYAYNSAFDGLRCENWGTYDLDPICNPDDFCSYGELKEGISNV